jgi:hypothetical protein
MTKIRRSAKNEACALRVSPQCQDGETVVLCHLNSAQKGVGIKSPDIFGVYGCYSCHQMLDAGLVNYSDRLRALQETQFKLIEKGLLNVS